MALTFAQALVRIQKSIADSSNDTDVTQCLNQAQRQVARARRWPELMVRAFFNTEAAYSTGTVAVANGGTTWTLTGGTFPTGAETGKWRIAKSFTSPWYEVVTRTDPTHIKTAAYQDDTETESTFVIYRSHYSLASAADRVEELWIHQSGKAYPLVNAATDERVTEFSHYPIGAGVPYAYYNMERDSSDNRQILLGPSTPDDVYRTEYVYRKKTTDGTFSGNLDESRWPVVVALAASMAYEPEFYQRSLTEYKRYQVLLNEEWGDESESESKSVIVGQNRVDFPGLYGWHDTLMGNGEINYPS